MLTIFVYLVKTGTCHLSIYDASPPFLFCDIFLRTVNPKLFVSYLDSYKISLSMKMQLYMDHYTVEMGCILRPGYLNAYT